jgi:hypothetical protein
VIEFLLMLLIERLRHGAALGGDDRFKPGTGGAVVVHHPRAELPDLRV